MPLDPSIFLRGAEMQARNDEETRAIIGGIFDRLAQSKQMPDIEKGAMAAIYKQEAGVEPSAQEKAAFGAWQKLRSSEQIFDPATQSVIPKYNMGVFGTLQNAQTEPYRSPWDTPGIVPAEDAQRSPMPPMEGNKPYVNDIGAMSMPPVGDNYAEVSGGVDRGAARGLPVPSNPRQAQTAFEAQTDIAKEGAKKAASLEAEKQFSAPKAKAKLQDEIATLSNLDPQITKAINATGKMTAGMGSLLQVVPGTPAADLSATLDTIKADAAFGALQNMRDNSPTGGALGGIAVQELKLLEASQAALAQSQSPAQLKSNLQNYQKVRRNALKRVADAYEQQYGEKLNIPSFGDSEKSGPVSYQEYFK